MKNEIGTREAASQYGPSRDCARISRAADDEGRLNADDVDASSCRRRRGNLLRVVLVAALLGTLAACSGENPKQVKVAREYEVPSELCGVHIDSGALAPFLPGGKKFTSHVVLEEKEVSRWCALTVDGKRVGHSFQEWHLEGYPLATFIKGMIPTTELTHRDIDGRTLWSGKEAFARSSRCRVPNVEVEPSVLFTAIKLGESTHADPKAMKRLIDSFTESAETMKPC